LSKGGFETALQWFQRQKARRQTAFAADTFCAEARSRTLDSRARGRGRSDAEVVSSHRRSLSSDDSAAAQNNAEPIAEAAQSESETRSTGLGRRRPSLRGTAIAGGASVANGQRPAPAASSRELRDPSGLSPTPQQLGE